jgi:Zn-dependent peptidase ImmA (M78 family)
LVFDQVWETASDNLKKIARNFKVSERVIARRALDTGKWSKSQFLRGL